MKKIILFVFLAVFSLSAFAITPNSKSKSDKTNTPEKKENKLSENEINRLSKRVEETPGMEKAKQTIEVREGHRGRGHEGMHRNNRRSGGVVFVGGGTILVIILIILLV